MSAGGKGGLTFLRGMRASVKKGKVGENKRRGREGGGKVKKLDLLGRVHRVIENH